MSSQCRLPVFGIPGGFSTPLQGCCSWDCTANLAEMWPASHKDKSSWEMFMLCESSYKITCSLFFFFSVSLAALEVLLAR